ncbi:MAG: serine phosphatase RsbU (regulator of sigma subunit) [Parvicella sp.]
MKIKYKFRLVQRAVSTKFNCVLLILLFTSVVKPISAQDEFFVKSGLADFSNCDFQTEKCALDGFWSFYESKLLSPSDIENIDIESKQGFVPEFWKNYQFGEFSSFGYATYRMRGLLPSKHPELGIYIEKIHSSYKVFVNGQLVSEEGKVGSTKESSIPHWLPKVIRLDDVRDSIDIIIQVSNFNHRNGGIEKSIVLGSYNNLVSDYKHQYSVELFLGGSCFILGFFFLGMFVFWRKDRAALHFGLFALSFASRVLLTGTRTIIDTFPDLDWNVTIRMEYLGLFLMHYSLFHFIYYAFRKETNYKYVVILRYVTAVMLLCVFIPGYYFTFSSIPNNFYVLMTFCYSMYIFVLAYKRKVPGAQWAVGSFVLFFITTIPLLLEYSGFFTTNPFVLAILYILFMLSFALVFAARFGYSFRNLEELKNREAKKNIEINIQKKKLQESNELINDSIFYAKSIQQSLMPSEIEIQRAIPSSFKYFQPLNQVSGDFYWLNKNKSDSTWSFALADCTGHGVPGAFMSLIGINALDMIIKDNPDIMPNEFIRQLDSIIYQKLKANKESRKSVKDGMDILIMKVDLQQGKVWFSSAHQRLLHLSDKRHQVYKGQNISIGSKLSDSTEIDLVEIDVKKNDQVYLFTDGVYDQKGGSDGKKLYPQRLIDILISNSDLSVTDQKSEIISFMKDWRKETNQIDDMSLFGFKL